MSEGSKKETVSVRFRRVARRLKKRLQGKPLTLDDISTIRMAESWGATYKAKRNPQGNWDAYMIYGVPSNSPEIPGYTVCKNLGENMSPQQAIETLAKASPLAMKHKTNRHNHPVQVAKLIS